MRARVFLLLVVAAVVLFEPGTAKPNKPKVVGGVPALPGEFPFQISLQNARWGHSCGGAILSPSLVVTAGVCTDPTNPGNYQVVAGSLKITEPVPWRQVANIRQIVVHPGYNASTMANDLALLFLDSPLTFNENVSSISLPPAFIETFPNPVVLTGWGNVQYGEPLFEDLQKVTLDTYSDPHCEELVGQEVKPEILCTGGDEGGQGGCQGDAGSPLIVDFSNNSVISAVLSHFPCPLPDCCGTPGPNDQSTELSFFVDWIQEQSRLFGGGL